MVNLKSLTSAVGASVGETAGKLDIKYGLAVIGDKTKGLAQAAVPLAQQVMAFPIPQAEMANSLTTTYLPMQGADFAVSNPGAAACAAVVIGGVTVIAAPGLVSAPLLGVAGFGPGGVVAGT